MTHARIWVVAALPVLLSGCLDKEFEKRSIVGQWRTLAIVADPPVAAVGDVLRFEPLVVDPDGDDVRHGEGEVTYSWAACVRPERVPGLSGLQYEPDQPSAACGSTTALPLPTAADGSATLDTGALLEMLRAVLPVELDELPALLAAQLGVPEALATRLLEEVGVPFVVELRVCQGPSCAGTPTDDAIRVTAFKRFLLTTGVVVGRNPPPVRFRLCPGQDACGDDEGVWMSADRPGAPFECLPEDGITPTLDAGGHVVLDPEDGQDEWLEEYTVLNLQAEFITVQERAYYSWFATGGSFDQEITRAPTDQEIWRTPDDPGQTPLWVVVRDGHGGTAACRATIELR